jgi:hypothetical protein
MAVAEDFEPVDSAAEQTQSRRYDVKDPKILLQASLAILQDIRFLVTKSEVEPGVLVAQAPWRLCRCNKSLTISLQNVPGQTDSYEIRLTASTATGKEMFNKAIQPDYTDFYQGFFTHLDRELFKERK